MSKFISVHILSAIRLGGSKRTPSRETPRAPAVAELQADAAPGSRDEPPSASRVRVERVRIDG
jgi:hypothetical protein